MTNQNASENHERFVNVGASFPAHTEASELMQPGQTAFDHPAGLAQAAAMGHPALGQDRRDAARPQRVTVQRGIVPAIALHPVGTEPGMADPAGNRWNPLDQHQQLRHIVAMRTGEGGCQRNAVRVGNEMMLRPRLPAVRGIGARLRPPKTARTDDESTTAREKSILSAPRSLFKRVRWTVSHTPALCQSRRRRQQVMPVHPISRGKSSHGMPVFKTNRIPVSTARLSLGFRPGYRRRRRFTGKCGAITPHNASSKITLAMEMPPSHDRKISYRRQTQHSFC
jgi:hypothetical protein